MVSSSVDKQQQRQQAVAKYSALWSWTAESGTASSTSSS
jgi:hypothetical protein